MNHYNVPTVKKEIAPPTFLGTKPFPIAWEDYDWFNDLPNNTYFALWLRNPSESILPIDLPPGHDLYVITFHYEHVDCRWLMDQVSKITQPILVLNDGSGYDFPWPGHVHFFNFYSWHIHLEQIMTWFPHRQQRNLKYKVSAVCNRITQSKLIITTALLENFAPQEILVKLGTWLNEKDVHYKQPSGNLLLDNLSNIFFEKYYGQEILVDDFTDVTHNFQRVNSNPWQPLYLESAIHFTNQSYHYSFMQDVIGTYTRPGPCIDEKTFKCLLSKTPFISVGQFDVYHQLSKLGLIFDYGNVDLNWDNDPGNLSRLCDIVRTILSLKEYDISELDHMTKDSSQHNAEQIWSGVFANKCREHNQKCAKIILDQFA
jgi:hypothetical protein